MSFKGVQVLNDLLLINNDRIKGYELALRELSRRDADLQAIFSDMILQTKKFNGQLTLLVEKSGAIPETETSVSGRLHRIWIDIKAAFTGKSRKGLLAECERGEDASKDAYNEALHGEYELTAEQIDLLTQQAEEQQVSHDLIKAARERERNK